MFVEFVTGSMQQFVATRDFALNFDDPKTTPSVKIREGQVLLYDGISATYKKDGAIITGRCRSLKSAIVNAQWMIPAVLPIEVTDEFSKSMREADESTDEFSDLLQQKNDVPVEEEMVQIRKSDYDALRGGNFDAFAAGNSSDVFVAPLPNKQKNNVILEQDLIVKVFNTKEKIAEEKSGKLEVAGDQVAVRKVGAISVNSSTAVVNQPEKRTPKIIRADEMGAEGTIPLKMSKAASSQAPEKKKNTFIVDASTPRTVSEDMTREEIHRITKVVNADESQDAMIVSTIKQGPKVKEVDGITFRKTDSPLEVTLKKVKSPTEMTVTTRVGSGSTPVEDPTGRTVTASKPVQEVELQEPDPVDEKKVEEDTAAKKAHEEAAAKKAKERADARKKASAQTQKLMEVGKKPALKKTATKKETVESKVKSQEESVPAEGNADNYLLMLPDDWGKLHWVKKESFIKELTDVGFIKFILSVETINAVQKACVERLKQLEQEAAG